MLNAGIDVLCDALSVGFLPLAAAGHLHVLRLLSGWQGQSPKAVSSSQWRASWALPQGAAHFPPPGQGSQAANILWLVTVHTPANSSEGEIFLCPLLVYHMHGAITCKGDLSL